MLVKIEHFIYSLLRQKSPLKYFAKSSLFIFTLLILFGHPAFAEDSITNPITEIDSKKHDLEQVNCYDKDNIAVPDKFRDKKDEGWLSYKDPRPCRKEDKEKEPETTKKEEPEKEKPVTGPDPKFKKENKPSKTTFEVAMTTMDVEEYKKALDDLRAVAIFFPTEQNLYQYIRSQKRAMDVSQKFANAWQIVIKKYPGLDYESEMSATTMGLKIRDMIKKQTVNNKIASLQDRAGVVFFFDSKDPYSIEQSKVLKSLQIEHNLTVRAVSMDGGVLPEYPDAAADKNISKKMDVKTIPSIYLFYSKTNEYAIVSPFFAPYDKLEQKLYEAASIIDGENPFDKDSPLFDLTSPMEGSLSGDGFAPIDAYRDPILSFQ